MEKQMLYNIEKLAMKKKIIIINKIKIKNEAVAMGFKI